MRTDESVADTLDHYQSLDMTGKVWQRSDKIYIELGDSRCIPAGRNGFRPVNIIHDWDMGDREETVLVFKQVE